jgi:hypothetical protein
MKRSGESEQGLGELVGPEPGMTRDREGGATPEVDTSSGKRVPPVHKVRASGRRTYRISVLGRIPSNVAARVSSMHASALLHPRQSAIEQASGTQRSVRKDPN